MKSLHLLFSSLSASFVMLQLSLVRRRKLQHETSQKITSHNLDIHEVIKSIPDPRMFEYF